MKENKTETHLLALRQPLLGGGQPLPALLRQGQRVLEPAGQVRLWLIVVVI
jgi:hypothetical protein